MVRDLDVDGMVMQTWSFENKVWGYIADLSGFGVGQWRALFNMVLDFWVLK
jgi:hypothetical protein